LKPETRLRVRIERLAPTGEGIARTDAGVGFVDRALPGELVETNVYQVKRRFWRGSLGAVLEASPDRVETAHAGCAGCDWAHFDPAAARRAKQELFAETLERIGHLDPRESGEHPVEPSPGGYRLRLRLHAKGRGDSAEIGYFAPRTHRVEPASQCEALAPATRGLLPRLRDEIARSGAAVSELALLEDSSAERRLLRVTIDGDRRAAEGLAFRLAPHVTGIRVESARGEARFSSGERVLDIPVRGRRFAVSLNSFFQINRHLVATLAEEVEFEARRTPPGEALDAFGGAGLFAGSLLSADHRVTTVESDPGAVADARRTRRRWQDRDRWTIVCSDVQGFVSRDDRRFGCVVVDPPRAGLGRDLARGIARRVGGVLIYVSCDPATLARDLSTLREERLHLTRVRLFDLFAFTHRLEAIATLERAA